MDIDGSQGASSSNKSLSQNDEKKAWEKAKIT